MNRGEPMPKMDVVAVGIDVPRLEADLRDRAGTHKDVGGNAGLVLRIADFPGAKDDVADAAAVEAGAGKPPGGEQVLAGGSFSNHERGGGAVRDGRKRYFFLFF